MYDQFLNNNIPIFGLYGAKNGKCDCGNPECEALFKHPVASNWQHSPIWSDEQLEVMEMTNQLATGYGVLVRGLLVVDIDARNGGVKSYEKLLKNIPGLSKCGFVVKTGSGNGSKHLYFRVDSSISLMQSHPDYAGIDFKSSGYTVGPGSMHASGELYECTVGDPSDIGPAPQELLSLLERPEQFRTIYDGQQVDVSANDIGEMLSHISPDCDHDIWVRCGMAIHHCTNGTGCSIWDDWSNKSDKYPGRSAIDKRWHSFGKTSTPVGYSTLKSYAEDGGYLESVEFVCDIDFGEVEQDKTFDGPFDTAGVDLLRPPGFVGEVCTWINGQCRYPREHLAVAASLISVGNICGLKYEDDLDGVTANLFAFCVAGSGTGKESIMQATIDVHRAAGIHGATMGSIKSEQEITRNLTRHQASFYIIDEIGELLAKIANAKKHGGASYLDGVIGLLMAAYSKASGYMLLTGDMKEDVRQTLIKQLEQCRRKINDNEDETGQFRELEPSIKRALKSIDNGLERPYLSLMGFTIPETFNELVTASMATNGFIGRSFLTPERETNPRMKRGFKKKPMEDSLRFALAGLYNCGEFSALIHRVEHYGNRIKVKTNPEAAQMLSDALDWLEDYAETQKERSGLEAVVRRGYEIMAKVSFVLACPSGLRTAEHVRWAFAFMKRDIEYKIMLASGNDAGNSVKKLASAIMGLIDNDHAETIGVIRKRCRKWKKEDVDKVLEQLVSSGNVLVIRDVHKGNKREITKYRASDTYSGL